MKLSAEFWMKDGMKNIYGFEGEPEELMEHIMTNYPPVEKIYIYLDEPLVVWGNKE